MFGYRSRQYENSHSYANQISSVDNIQSSIKPSRSIPKSSQLNYKCIPPYVRIIDDDTKQSNATKTAGSIDFQHVPFTLRYPFPSSSLIQNHTSVATNRHMQAAERFIRLVNGSALNEAVLDIGTHRDGMIATYIQRRIQGTYVGMNCMSHHSVSGDGTSNGNGVDDHSSSFPTSVTYSTPDTYYLGINCSRDTSQSQSQSHSAFSLPFADHSFRYILSLETNSLSLSLSHIGDKDILGLLSEIHRVLLPGGVALLSHDSWNGPKGHRLHDHLVQTYDRYNNVNVMGGGSGGGGGGNTNTANNNNMSRYRNDYNFIPPWGHLLYNRAELGTLLRNKRAFLTEVELQHFLDYIYSSSSSDSDNNRMFSEDVMEHIQSLDWTVDLLETSQPFSHRNMKKHMDVIKMLKLKYGSHRKFNVGHMTVIVRKRLDKPVNEHSNRCINKI